MSRAVFQGNYLFSSSESPKYTKKSELFSNLTAITSSSEYP